MNCFQTTFLAALNMGDAFLIFFHKKTRFEFDWCNWIGDWFLFLYRLQWTRCLLFFHGWIIYCHIFTMVHHNTIPSFVYRSLRIVRNKTKNVGNWSWSECIYVCVKYVNLVEKFQMTQRRTMWVQIKILLVSLFKWRIQSVRFTHVMPCRVSGAAVKIWR